MALFLCHSYRTCSSSLALNFNHLGSFGKPRFLQSLSFSLHFTPRCPQSVDYLLLSLLHEMPVDCLSVQASNRVPAEVWGQRNAVPALPGLCSQILVTLDSESRRTVSYLRTPLPSPGTSLLCCTATFAFAAVPWKRQGHRESQRQLLADFAAL